MTLHWHSLCYIPLQIGWRVIDNRVIMTVIYDMASVLNLYLVPRPHVAGLGTRFVFTTALLNFVLWPLWNCWVCTCRSEGELSCTITIVHMHANLEDLWSSHKFRVYSTFPPSVSTDSRVYIHFARGGFYGWFGRWGWENGMRTQGCVCVTVCMWIKGQRRLFFPSFTCAPLQLNHHVKYKL